MMWCTQYRVGQERFQMSWSQLDCHAELSRMYFEGVRMIVLRKLQERVMQEVHLCHSGIVWLKSLASSGPNQTTTLNIWSRLAWIASGPPDHGREFTLIILAPDIIEVKSSPSSSTIHVHELHKSFTAYRTVGIWQRTYLPLGHSVLALYFPWPSGVLARALIAITTLQCSGGDH